MCHGDGNHALAEVVHSEVDQASHQDVAHHILLENVFSGQTPRV